MRNKSHVALFRHQRVCAEGETKFNLKYENHYITCRGIFSIVIKRVAHLNCTVVVSLIIVSVDIVFYFVGHLLGG